ncbi:serine protease inhibitor swm-1-like [Prorops nasuta]|uniref:serine protease inhibitor swm-1-like n=1 Tax=Prorops nasuta TaxID=863751 RepID=UPI0034CEFE80
MNHMTLVLFVILAACCVYAQEEPSATIPRGKCHANETMRVCKTVCEATCDNPEPGICNKRPARICRRGCQCNPDYLRDEKIMRCVLAENCS